MTSTRQNRAGFAKQYRRQFRVIDAKGKERISLKNMKQGWRTMTKYWNEFRLGASGTELDDSTACEWLLEGMNTDQRNAWGASSDKYPSS